MFRPFEMCVLILTFVIIVLAEVFPGNPPVTINSVSTELIAIRAPQDYDSCFRETLVCHNSCRAYEEECVLGTIVAQQMSRL